MPIIPVGGFGAGLPAQGGNPNAPTGGNTASDPRPGIIAPTDLAGRFTGTGAAVYTDYQVINYFEKDGHRYMMGIASPGGFRGKSVAFVQLASPTLLWIADWTASRFGDLPVVPDPTPANSDWVLLDDHWTPAMLLLAADGVSALYRITGTFVYGHCDPNPDTIANINFARPPWLEDSFTRIMTKSNLERGLISVTQTFQGAARP